VYERGGRERERERQGNGINKGYRDEIYKEKATER
jgi:hypothetical protein